MRSHDVLIVGAGPAGLATAIAARQAGLDYAVLEKGTLVDSIYRFPTHMVFFTTPELLEIGGMPFVTPYEKPTRLEALRYYRRVTDSLGLRVELGREVTSVRRGPEGRFVAVSRSAGGAGEEVEAGAVVMAIGYYDHPNRLAVAGEDLPHVSHYYRDAHPFYRKRVTVVGGGNSAAEASLELYRAGAKVTLVHRHATMSREIKYWVLPDIENRIKEGNIRAIMCARVSGITPQGVLVESDGGSETVPSDAVFLLTGYHPDFALLAGAGVAIDEEDGQACYHPETFETNVRNLFLAGGAVAGRHKAPVFIENGRYHGAKIIEVIAARLAGKSTNE